MASTLIIKYSQPIEERKAWMKQFQWRLFALFVAVYSECPELTAGSHGTIQSNMLADISFGWKSVDLT